MPMFRKKPVVIEAREFTVETMRDVAAWCAGEWRYENGDEFKPYIAIKTLEGTMTADVGDWIIRGVNGEFYPCKPDIFAATYDPAPGGTENA